MQGRLVVDGLREGPEIVIPDEETMKSLEGLPRGQYTPKFKQDGYEPVHEIEKERVPGFLSLNFHKMAAYCIFPGELVKETPVNRRDPKYFTLFYKKTLYYGPERYLKYERPVDPVKELAEEVMVLYSPK
jgi:hypothetical protein